MFSNFKSASVALVGLSLALGACANTNADNSSLIRNWSKSENTAIQSDRDGSECHQFADSRLPVSVGNRDTAHEEINRRTRAVDFATCMSARGYSPVLAGSDRWSQPGKNQIPGSADGNACHQLADARVPSSLALGGVVSAEATRREQAVEFANCIAARGYNTIPVNATGSTGSAIR